MLATLIISFLCIITIETYHNLEFLSTKAIINNEQFKFYIMSFSALEEENEDEIKYIDSVIINKLLNLNTCKKCIRFYLRQFRDPNFVEDYVS